MIVIKHEKRASAAFHYLFRYFLIISNRYSNAVKTNENDNNFGEFTEISNELIRIYELNPFKGGDKIQFNDKNNAKKCIYIFSKHFLNIFLNQNPKSKGHQEIYVFIDDLNRICSINSSEENIKNHRINIRRSFEFYFLNNFYEKNNYSM